MDMFDLPSFQGFGRTSGSCWNELSIFFILTVKAIRARLGSNTAKRKTRENIIKIQRRASNTFVFKSWWRPEEKQIKMLCCTWALCGTVHKEKVYIWIKISGNFGIMESTLCLRSVNSNCTQRYSSCAHPWPQALAFLGVSRKLRPTVQARTKRTKIYP